LRRRKIKELQYLALWELDMDCKLASEFPLHM
jgi:hypothetical protein